MQIETSLHQVKVIQYNDKMPLYIHAATKLQSLFSPLGKMQREDGDRVQNKWGKENEKVSKQSYDCVAKDLCLQKLGKSFHRNPK